MTINIIAASFDFWEGLKIVFLSFFWQRLIFNENEDEDDVTDKISWQIFRTLSTENLEYLIVF